MANRVEKFFQMAKDRALKGDAKNANRHYRIGAVGIRRDGVVVFANNVSSRTPHAQCHAEARLTRKLNVDSCVYVVRISADNQLKPARPCPRCQRILRLRGIKKVYYSIAENEYGVMEF